MSANNQYSNLSLGLNIAPPERFPIETKGGPLVPYQKAGALVKLPEIDLTLNKPSVNLWQRVVDRLRNLCTKLKERVSNLNQSKEQPPINLAGNLKPFIHEGQKYIYSELSLMAKLADLKGSTINEKLLDALTWYPNIFELEVRRNLSHALSSPYDLETLEQREQESIDRIKIYQSKLSYFRQCYYILEGLKGLIDQVQAKSEIKKIGTGCNEELQKLEDLQGFLLSLMSPSTKDSFEVLAQSFDQTVEAFRGHLVKFLKSLAAEREIEDLRLKISKEVSFFSDGNSSSPKDKFDFVVLCQKLSMIPDLPFSTLAQINQALDGELSDNVDSRLERRAFLMNLANTHFFWIRDSEGLIRKVAKDKIMN
jgi:hypothetical protein